MKQGQTVVFVGESSLRGKKGQLIKRHAGYGYFKVKGHSGEVIVKIGQFRPLTRIADIPFIGWIFGK